jgi:ABC-type multidrug transport system ATPase subunit
MTAAIEITALTRKFDSLVAVDHLDLTVERGELFGLGFCSWTSVRWLTPW